MTAEQAKKQFDSLKDFKERYLFWEENKALIQQSFIDLQSELKLLSDRELERSMERIKQQGRGAVYHTRNEEEQRDFSRICEINSFIESIEPLPKEEEEKAFVAQFKINEHQKYLEADKDSIVYSFDTYKREYREKLNKMALKEEFIHNELKRIKKHLKSCKALVGKVVIDSIRSKANEGYEVDYKKLYEYGIYPHTDFYKLALIISPTQYSIFLENEKRNLGTTTQTVASETRTIDKGFDSTYSNEQLEQLHDLLINANYLDRKTDVCHFVNAFNGQVLEERFKPLKWVKIVYGAVLLITLFDTDRKDLKVWKNAKRLFSAGNANSLKNAFKGTDLHETYKTRMETLIKSLQ
jgi:hypothetical protein